MEDKKHPNLDAKKYIPFVEDQKHPNLDVHIKTHGRVSAAKEDVWHTSVLFTGQDTRSCVSGQGRRVAHKCIIYRNR